MELMILGKNYTVVEERSNKDSVEIKDDKILVLTNKKPPSVLLKEFLEDLLLSQLYKIYDQIKDRKIIDIFGDLDFEVVEKIDNKKERVAKLKGNKILVKLNAISLPKSVLKYVVTHEIAHIVTKRHTKKFWNTVELLCSDFKRSQDFLSEYSDLLIKPIDFKSKVWCLE
ncbi:MAG: M48 family metallopeptidase [Nitrososphaerota archaeon]